MALAAAVSALMQKLQWILDDKELNNPSLRRQITIAMEKLLYIRSMLSTDVEAKQTDKQKMENLETNFLQSFYTSEDMIDSFRIKIALQRRIFFAKMRPFNQFMLLQSQIDTRNHMKKFVREIEVALTEGEDGGEKEKASKAYGGDQESVQTDSNKQIVHPDEQSYPDEQPEEPQQKDGQSASHTVPSSSEVVGSSVSDLQHVQTPASNSQDLAPEPSSQRPATEPSSQQPATEQSSQQPITEQSSQQPATKQSTQQPATEPSSQQPETEPSSQRPATEQSSQQPATEPSSQQPATEPSSQQPETDTSSQQPATEPSSQQPATDTTSQQPATEQSSQRPATEQSSQQPATEPSSQQPATEQSSQQPATEPSSQQPATESSSEQPATESSSQQQATESSSQQPATEPSSHQHETEPTQSASELQPVQTLEPNSQDLATEHSSQQPATEPSSQQPAANPSSKQLAIERSSQQAVANPSKSETEGRISDVKGDVQNVKQQVSGEPGAQITGTTMSGEKQALQQSTSNSDRLDDDSDFTGRKDQTDKLTQDIHNRYSMHFRISVVGAAGSGKTTFVRNIYNKADVVQHFQLRSWVNVSEEFPDQKVAPEDGDQKTKDLLIDILRQVTTIKEEEKLSLDKLEEKVRDFFIRKRFLLVLDDVKTPDILESIKRTFPNSLNGSRMILITREETIAKNMSDQGFTIELNNLDINDSWTLFLKKARQKKDLQNEYLKELIYEKCKGLPLAIVVLGGLLSNKEPRSWSNMVQRLNFGDDLSKAVLALAYQDLSPELKPCLLYLGLFPKEYEISTRRLFRLWAAEGLAYSNGQTPESLVEIYLEELRRRNMIEISKWRLDGSPKKCRVPGILYDNVFPNAADIGFFHVLRSKPKDHEQNPKDHEQSPKDHEQSKSNSNIRRVAAYVDISDLVLDNLRSYIAFSRRKGDTPADEIDKFINNSIGNRGFGLLNVLDLEGIYKPVLSEKIGKLFNLSYLGLRWTFLDSIPNSIGDLPILETLDVKHTNVTSLPISIWNSKKLRHLYMNEIYLDMSLQKPLASRSLGNLLTLWGLVIGKKSLRGDWFSRLTGLKKLGLTCHFASLDQINTWISKSENLQSLKLRSIDEYSRPAELKLCTMERHKHLSELYLLGKLSHEIDELQLQEGLKMLTLSVSQLRNDPMECLGKLPQLKILRLFGRSYVGNEMTCHANGFPQLRVLKLWMLEKLEKWTVQEGSMPFLKEMEIRLCEKMKETSGFEHLTTLGELTLTNMPSKFVAEIEKSMNRPAGRKATVIVNNWEFAPFPEQ